jgi:hypothetical protein
MLSETDNDHTKCSVGDIMMITLMMIHYIYLLCKLYIYDC